MDLSLRHAGPFLLRRRRGLQADELPMNFRSIAARPVMGCDSSSRRLTKLPRMVLGLGVAALSAASFISCGNQSTAQLPPKTNLLLITLDTTRADHLGSYGYTEAVTPVLDGLAAGGVRFEYCMSVAPITLPSHASILSGQLPFNHGARNNGTHRLPEDVPTLSTLLSAEGYTTGAVVSAFVLDSRFGLARGFDVYDDDLSQAVQAPMFMFRETRADDGVRRAQKFLDGVQEGPWFLWLHLFDPHADYDAPEPFSSNAPSPYDAEIAYSDHMLGVLLEDLKRRGQLDNTLIAFTADHGEALGEHQERSHGLFVYDATIHVPWILSHPSLTGGTVVSGVVSGADLAPTVLELLGTPSVPMDGRSHGSVCMGGEPLETGAGAYSEGMSSFFDHGWSDLRSLRNDRWRSIRAPRPELYDLKNDPEELADRSKDEGARLEGMGEDLEELLADGERDVRRVDAGSDSLEVAETLAALGYASGAAEGNISDGPLSDPKDKVTFWGRSQVVQELVRSDRFEEAEEAILMLLEEEPGDAMLRTARGEVLRQLGRTEEALEWMKSTVTGSGATSTDWLELAEIEREVGLGAWRERLAAAQKMDPLNPLPLVREGDWLTEDGAFKEARAAYERALVIDERSAEAWVGIGHLEHQLGRDAVAEAAIRKGLDADPLSADAWFNLAVVVEALKRTEEARGHYRKTLGIEPTHLRALVNLGISLVSAGEYAEAEPLIQEARALDPAEGRATYSLALLWMRTERGGQAELLLLEQLAATPDVPELQRLLVFVTEGQGDSVRTGQLAAEVLLRTPKDPWMIVFTVEGLVAGGDPGRALAVLSAARTPNNAELEKLIQGRKVLRELVQ